MSVVTQSGTLPRSYLSSVMKLPTARTIRKISKKVTLNQTTYDYLNVAVPATAKPTRVQWNVEIPVGTAFKPVIRAEYTMKVQTNLDYIGVDPKPTEEATTRLRPIFHNMIHNPTPSTINKLIDQATVRFNNSYAYGTEGDASYTVNQLFKSKEERDSYSSRLNNNAKFRPYGAPTNILRDINSLAIPLISEAVHLLGDKDEDDTVNVYNYVNEYRVNDWLEIEPFMSPFVADNCAPFVGINVLDIDIMFGARSGRNLLQPIGVDEGITDADAARTTTITFSDITLYIECVEFQTPILPMTDGIHNLHYQRLELFTFPIEYTANIDMEDLRTKQIEVVVNSIPQYFLFQLKDLNRASTRFNNSAPLSVLQYLKVRLTTLGDDYAEFDKSSFTELFNRYADTRAGIPLAYQRASDIRDVNILSQAAPVIVFDPIFDIGGPQRAAGQASQLYYHFEIGFTANTQGSQSNPSNLRLEVIAVHLNPAGNRQNRFQPSLANYTQDQVNNVYRQIQNGSINVLVNGSQ